MKPIAAKPPHSSLAASAPSGEGREADSLPEGLAPEIDPVRIARAGERLVGSTSVARMPRLLASGLLDENTLVRWQLQGESGRDELDRVRQFLVLSLQFAPVVACGRCLGPLPLDELSVTRRFRTPGRARRLRSRGGCGRDRRRAPVGAGGADRGRGHAGTAHGGFPRCLPQFRHTQLKWATCSNFPGLVIILDCPPQGWREYSHGRSAKQEDAVQARHASFARSPGKPAGCRRAYHGRSALASPHQPQWLLSGQEDRQDKV